MTTHAFLVWIDDDRDPEVARAKLAERISRVLHYNVKPGIEVQAAGETAGGFYAPWTGARRLRFEQDVSTRPAAHDHEAGA